MEYSNQNSSDKDLDLEFAFQDTANKVERENNYTPPNSYRSRPIDYIDPAPKPFVVQIPLVEYFKYIKKLHPDKWQVDFMSRLQDAAVNRPDHRTWALIHAEGQLGKSSILAQIYAAWLFGHDPLHRFALATHGVERSQSHAKIVINIMNYDIHKQIFPNKDGWVRPTASMEKWKTNARLDLPESQDSYNPVGLASGLVGSGFSTLVVDDPYAKEADAFSDATRRALQSFWDSTVVSRLDAHSNVFGMFHRYHEQDLAGYLLDKGIGFDYWRYASECDGDYLHQATGQRFPDPLGRQIGELISERRGEDHYTLARKIPRIWNSMFQGKPASDSGDFFNIDKIAIIKNPIEARDEWNKCIGVTRSWDHAATDGAGDFTAGALMGMQPDGTIIIKDMRLVQLDSAERVGFQKQVAADDGVNVPVCIPQEVGEAGKTLVFAMRQFLAGYTVVPRHVQTGTQSFTLGNNPKQRRAYNFSVAVNSGQVKFVEDEWNSETLRALKYFGFTTFDDPCDALGDGYNYLFETFHKGLVIKSQPVYRPWSEFAYGPIENGQRIPKVPAVWTVYVAVKITPEENAPNSAAIIARASENSGLKDTLFILGEYKEYDTDYEKVFTWIDTTLNLRCEKPETSTIWLHRDSETYQTAIRQKLKQPVRIFDHEDEAGLVEANWYVQNEKLIGLGDLVNIKQEAATWGYNDKGEPTKIGQVWNCVRMVAYAFRTRMVLMHPEERRELGIAPAFRLDTINEQKDNISEEEFGRKLITRQAQLMTKKLFNPNKKTKDRMSKFRR